MNQTDNNKYYNLNSEIKVSNDIVRSNYSHLNLMAFRVFVAALVDYQEGNTIISIRKSEIMRQFGYQRIGKKEIDSIQDMLTQPIKNLQVSEDKIAAFPIFKSVIIEDNSEENFLVLKVNDELVHYLNPRSSFSLVKYVNFLAMDQEYEKSTIYYDLYWFLKSYSFRKVITISIDELKEKFQFNDYRHFKADILQKAITIINTRSDLSVSYTEKKSNRSNHKVVSLTFCLDSNVLPTNIIKKLNEKILQKFISLKGDVNNVSKEDLKDFSFPLKVKGAIQFLDPNNTYGIDNFYAFISRVMLPCQKLFNNNNNIKVKMYIRENYDYYSKGSLDDSANIIISFGLKEKFEMNIKQTTIRIDDCELLSVKSVIDESIDDEGLACYKYSENLSVSQEIKDKWSMYSDISRHFPEPFTDAQCLEILDCLLSSAQANGCDISETWNGLSQIIEQYIIKQSEIRSKTTSVRKTYILKMIANFKWKKNNYNLDMFGDD